MKTITAIVHAISNFSGGNTRTVAHVYNPAQGREFGAFHSYSASNASMEVKKALGLGHEDVLVIESQVNAREWKQAAAGAFYKVEEALSKVCLLK